MRERVRFHHERGMEHSLFVYLFFSSLNARLDFKHGKINKKTKNDPFYARSGNEP